MDELDQFRTIFFEECTELLAQLESDLSALQGGATDSETLNSIFRAVHSIKAGAGAFKFAHLVEFSHRFEALLDCLRGGEIPVADAVVEVLFRASDVLAELVDNARAGIAAEAAAGAEVMAELQVLLHSARPGAVLDAAPKPVQSTPDSEAGPGHAALSERRYEIVFQPKADLFLHANEPLLLIRELRGIGSLVATPDLSRLPDLTAMDPEEAYVGWTFRLQTEQDVETIEEVFEFVGDDCTLTIRDLANQQEDSSNELPPLADDDPAAGLFEPWPPDGIADSEISAGPDAEVAAPVAEAAPVSAPAPVKAPAAGASAGGPARATQNGSIRVDLDRIDRLVNMVGELVITQSMLSQQTRDLPEDRFASVVRGMEELALHTRELQESVMAIRMQPVKSVFARMPRLVRDLGAKLDKKVRLEVVGENTEVDKTVVEEISDPITHMIRNSLDHGLETQEDRLAAGKPAEGCITLSAEHRSGRILITIRDDGRGINREVVLAKAREKGIVAPDQVLSDEEIDNLIFAPGFSTAQAVTDVSGRGVGMDVVRRNVQALGGRVGIQSIPGQGTCFTMTLPLTLAVMDGMIVAAGDEKYVLPITAIVECLRPARGTVNRLPSGQSVVHVRGEYIPLVFLGRVFNLPSALRDPCEALVVLVDSDSRGRVGIVVDELLGQQQVVIKSLEANYDPVEGISGATILGNGRVAAILDVEGLCGLVKADNSVRPAGTDTQAAAGPIAGATPMKSQQQWEARP